jgi:RecA-family ATPase
MTKKILHLVSDTGTLAVEVRVLETLCAADLDGLPIPRRQWLVKDVIPHRNVTLLSGDGGLGKTIIALMLGTSLSTRTTWLGLECMQGPFLYIGAEDDSDELHRRLDQMRRELGHSWGELADFHFRSFAGEDALVGIFDRSAQAMRATPLLAMIETRIRDLGAIACVLDTSADVFGGDEINRTQVRQFVGLLRGVCIRNDTSILLLAHPSLAGMASGSGTSGSTGWNNSVRSRMYLEADVKDPDARILKFMKSNYAAKAKPMRLRWQNGLFVPDDGEKAAAAAQINAEAKFLQMLDLYTAQERHVSASRSVMYAPTIFSRDPACKGFSMQVLQDAMNALFIKKEIVIETFGPPSKQRQRIKRE